MKMNTLQELYEALDWSEPNRSQAEWVKSCPLVPTEDLSGYEQALYSFRCALLEGAVNNNDRWAQVVLGDVWNQACALLKDGKSG